MILGTKRVCVAAAAPLSAQVLSVACVVCRACRGVDFQEEGVALNLKDIHKFVDEYEVELVARCCR